MIDRWVSGSSGDSTQLLYLRARHYTASIGRFLTRDTWGGDENQPVSYNLWLYGYSNPVRYTDPTGRFPAECLEADDFGACILEYALTAREKCLENDPHYNQQTYEEAIKRKYIESFGIKLEPEEKWTGKWLTNLYKVLFKDIGATALPHWLNHKKATLFIDKDGSAVCAPGIDSCYFARTGPTQITFMHTGNSINSEINILHELGHLVDNLSQGSNYFTNQLRSRKFTINEGTYWAGWNGKKYVPIPETGDNNVYQLVVREDFIGGDQAWQQKAQTFYSYTGHEQGEDWADIFANGILHNLDTSTEPGDEINLFFTSMESYAQSR